jgi:hypothetical protein
MKTKIIFALCLVLAGCASPVPVAPPTAAQITALTKYTYDSFRKYGSLSGPEMQLPPDYKRTWHARGSWFFTRDEASPAATGYQILISLHAINWAFLEQAFDREGNRLRTLQIDRKVDGGMVTEILAITLDRAYLEAHIKTGSDLRIDGSRGVVELWIPGFYIEGFLAVVDARQKNAPAPPAAPGT